jgi:hypothetical protein
MTILFNKATGGGSPAEGLNAQAAGTGANIKNPGTDQLPLAGNNTEKRLFNSVTCGAGL